MPVVSKSQNAAMRSAAAGHSTLGIPQSVGREFVSASHGMKVGKLPQHVKAGKPKRKLPVFGSLAPTQSGHYDGDIPNNPGEDA